MRKLLYTLRSFPELSKFRCYGLAVMEFPESLQVSLPVQRKAQSMVPALHFIQSFAVLNCLRFSETHTHPNPLIPYPLFLNIERARGGSLNMVCDSILGVCARDVYLLLCRYTVLSLYITCPGLPDAGTRRLYKLASRWLLHMLFPFPLWHGCITCQGVDEAHKCARDNHALG